MCEAIETCGRGLEIAPDHAGLATSCGQKYLVIRDLSRARKALERAIELDRSLSDEDGSATDEHFFDASPSTPMEMKTRRFWENAGLAAPARGTLC